MPSIIGPQQLPQEVFLDSEKRIKTADAKPEQGSFVKQLTNVLEGVDAAQKSAALKVQEFADGKQNDIHNTMITVEQADISLRFVANIRNRVIEAYREVMRMGA